MRSKNLRMVDKQFELDFVEPTPVQDTTIVYRKNTFMQAIALAAQLSSLEDKYIYMKMDIDAGHWTRIIQGKPGANFPSNKLNEYMDLVGNELPLIWLARSRGYSLVPLETALERELRIEREKNEALALENKVLRSLHVK